MVNHSCLLTLYHSLMYPHISYCNIIWASAYPSSLQKLLLIQKKFIQLATAAHRWESSAPLFKKLNLNLILTFIKQTKQAGDIYPPYYCTTLGQYALKYRGPLQYFETTVITSLKPVHHYSHLNLILQNSCAIVNILVMFMYHFIYDYYTFLFCLLYSHV